MHGEGETTHTVKLTARLQISLLALAISEEIELARQGGADPEDPLVALGTTCFVTGMDRKKPHRAARGKWFATLLCSSPWFAGSTMQKRLTLVCGQGGVARQRG